tara:strand:+ start:262 stop:576 length:315 start_codon:yes stop_codon:yes gene_type:complete
MSSGGYGGNGSEGATFISLTEGMPVGSSTGEAYNATLYLYHPSDTSVYTYIGGNQPYMQHQPYFNQGIAGGVRQANADVDAIQFYFSSGNVESGKISMYGIKGS